MPVPELPASALLAARSVEPEPVAPEAAAIAPEPGARVAAAEPAPRLAARSTAERREPAPRRDARRLRLPGSKAVILAGPLLTDGAGPATTLESEIAIDVLAGATALPPVDVLAGPPAAPVLPLPEVPASPDAA
jgi:hypothetical protein